MSSVTYKVNTLPVSFFPGYTGMLIRVPSVWRWMRVLECVRDYLLKPLIHRWPSRNFSCMFGNDIVQWQLTRLSNGHEGHVSLKPLKHKWECEEWVNVSVPEQRNDLYRSRTVSAGPPPDPLWGAFPRSLPSHSVPGLEFFTGTHKDSVASEGHVLHVLENCLDVFCSLCYFLGW